MDHPILFEGEPIPNVTEFRYLGMVFTPSLDMVHAAGQCVGSIMGGWREVLIESRARGVGGMPHVLLHLAQMYVLPKGLHSCQVWGPEMLSKGGMFDSKAQRALLSIYRRILGLRPSVAAASLVDEVGAYPLRRYWLKAVVNFWSSCIEAAEDNALLSEVLRMEVRLASAYSKSWLAGLVRVLSTLSMEVAAWEEDQPTALPVLDITRAWDTKVFADRCAACSDDPLDPGAEHRVQATYMSYFLMHKKHDRRVKHPYLLAGHSLPNCVVNNMARFRMSGHDLRVEIGRRVQLPFPARVCQRCADHPDAPANLPVDNEIHVLASCLSTAALRQLPRFADLPHHDIKALMRHTDVQSVALFVHKCMRVVDEDARMRRAE